MLTEPGFATSPDGHALNELSDLLHYESVRRQEIGYN
jgi:hypothetical protein